MWGHYGEYHSGFALAYCFDSASIVCSKKHIDCGNIWLKNPIFPVIYGKEFDGTEYVLQDFIDIMVGILTSETITLPFYDWLFFTKGYLYKSEDWAEEREWRLLSQKEPPLNDYKYIEYEASAIYCGMYFKSDNEQRLREIADKKGIPLYKMVLDADTRSLVPRQLI